MERKRRPGLPMRLLVGLHYLKHLYDVSDESAVAGFVENPYWQYFCGEEFFVHELPCDPTSLVKWRKRIGPGGMEKLLAETIAAAQRQQALMPLRDRAGECWIRRCRRKPLPFPPMRGCITKRGACWCAQSESTQPRRRLFL